MDTRLECIALRTVRVNDSRDLLSVWTRSHGRLTFAVPSGSGKGARRRRALTVPLAMFECVADLRPGAEIAYARDIAPLPYSLAYDASPLKGISAAFVAEALDLLLRRATPSDALSDYLDDSLRVFAASRPAATVNFHLLLLAGLTRYAGIEPDLSAISPTAVFDLREGICRPARPLHPDFVDGRGLRVLEALLRTPVRLGSLLHLGSEGRRAALDAILLYYACHLAPLSSLKSLEVLRSLD